MKPVFILVLFGVSVLPAITDAAEVRTVQPASHSLFPPQSGNPQEKSTQDASSLKPRTREAPSPVLVDYRASVDAAGKIEYGCETSSAHDFRAKALDKREQEKQP